MKPLPPFRSIEAFAAAVELRSLTAAAEALGLSLPALSRRIRILEEHLGAPLLERLPRGVVPTARGAAYAAELLPALDALRQATERARQADRRAVRISLIPTLAMTWLLPRLPGFQVAHPGIRLDLHGSADCVEPGAGIADLALRLGEGGWPRVMRVASMPLHLVVVASPDLPLGQPQDLLHLPLLGPAHRPEFWPEWARAVGIDPALLPPVRGFDNLQMLYEAAAHGLGVAIALDHLVRPWIENGRLVAPLDHRVASSRGIHLLTGSRPAPPGRVVRDWLRAEMTRSAA